MKLLFVNGHLGVGGVEKSLVDLLKSIDYSENEVDLLLFESYGEYFAQVPPEVNIIMCDLHATYGAFASVLTKSIRKRDFRAAIIKIILTISRYFGVKYMSLLEMMKFTNKYYDCAIAYRVGICAEYVGYVAKAKRKYMWWHYGAFDYDEQTVCRWRETLKKIDKIISVSNAAKELIKPQFPDKEIIVIPNMIIVDEILAKSDVFHPYMGKEGTILVSVGRLSAEKKMVNAVYAMEQLVGRGYDNITWYLVGDGEERKHIEDIVQEKNLQNKIICVGNQSNPYPYIKDADVFVHTSYVESQGIVVLEALALEKPCVVTRSIGIQEFIEDGRNALIAEQNVDSLVNKIIYLLTNYDIYDKLKKNQKSTVGQFSSSKILQKVKQVLEE